jgi:hypothetical protein
MPAIATPSTDIWDQVEREATGQGPGSGPEGLITPGNIDLMHRPNVRNPDGTSSSVRSISIGVDGNEVLIPTVSEDARIMSNEEAIQVYRQTGRHLGIFRSIDAANKAAEGIHLQQAAMGSAPAPSVWDQVEQEQGPAHAARDVMDGRQPMSALGPGPAFLDQLGVTDKDKAMDLGAQGLADNLGTDARITRVIMPDLVKPGEIAFSGPIGSGDTLSVPAAPADIQQENPIGLGEMIGKMDTGDWLELLPFSPAGMVRTADLYLAVQRLKADEYEGLAEQKDQEIQAMDPWARVTEDLRRAQMGDFSAWGPAVTANELKRQDTELVERYLQEQEELDRRGLTFWAQVGKGVSVLPAWMSEFALTGGLASLGKTAAKEAGVRLLRKQAESRIGKLALRAAGWSGGAITRATLGMPHRVTEEILDRRLAGEISLDDEGKIRIEVNPESWGTSIAKGWGETVISAATESAGGAIGEGVGAAMRPVVAQFDRIVNALPMGKTMIAGVERAWLALHPKGGHAEFVGKLFDRAGWNGLLEEIGEEDRKSVV